MHSELTNKVIHSPNHDDGRDGCDVSRITIHCIVGQATMDTLASIFAPTSREASANYGACIDGILCNVEEENRSWCSSSRYNDDRAITIETACDNSAPYNVRPEVWENVIELCVDICKRYNKKKLTNIKTKEALESYNQDSDEMILTQHNFFAATACPGDWIINHLDELADTVTNILNDTPAAPEPDTDTIYRVQVGAYKIRENAENMLNKLKDAGFDGFIATVSMSNNEEVEAPAPSVYLKDNDTIADEVIRGDWGNGEERRQRLTDAGYDYKTIQEIVNRRFS